MGVLTVLKAFGKVLTSREIAADEILVAPGVVVKKIAFSFREKLSWLENGEEVGRDFLVDMINQANSKEALVIIVNYLKKYPTDYLSLWDRQELLRIAFKKLMSITKDEELIKAWLAKNTIHLIESVVDVLW